MGNISQETSSQGDIGQRSGERKKDQDHWKKAGCSKDSYRWTNDPGEESAESFSIKPQKMEGE